MPPAAPHVTVAGLLVARGRALLCHRHPARRWYPDVWDLPGGHVEPGEEPGAALVRELREELGVRAPVPAGQPAGLRVPAADGQPAVQLLVWRVTAWEGIPVNRAPDEHDAIGWFRRREALGLDLAHTGYRALLRSALAGGGACPTGGDGVVEAPVP